MYCDQGKTNWKMGQSTKQSGNHRELQSNIGSQKKKQTQLFPNSAGWEMVVICSYDCESVLSFTT